jgi:hypothetical protein
MIGLEFLDFRIIMLLPLIIGGAILILKRKKIGKSFIPGILLCLLIVPLLWAFIGHNAEFNGIIVLLLITIPGYISLLIFGIVKLRKKLLK